MGYSGPIETLGAVRHGERDAEEIALSRLRWRTRLLGGTVILLIIAVASTGVRWFSQTIQYVSTDDAYVDAQLADIAPQTDGTIAFVAVSDTQSVKRGDLLLRLDPADAQLAVDQARANHEQAIRRVRQYVANASAAQASVAGRESDLARATIDFDRRAGLMKSGAVSGDEVSTARNALENARSALSVARQALAAQQAMVAEADIEQNPEVRTAEAALGRAELDLKRTEIRSPVDGIVAQNHAQIGQRVHTGTALMSVVPVRDAWVNANFKEVQLDRIRPGQNVSLTSDVYGSGVVFHGKVAGVGGGTGAAFSVIPAQNATGNWIKVVQRLPVRIALDPKELASKPLRVGLSMAVTVDLAPFAARKPAPVPKAAVGGGKKAPAPKVALVPAVIPAQTPAPVAAKPVAAKSAAIAPVRSKPVLANWAAPVLPKARLLRMMVPVLSMPVAQRSAALPPSASRARTTLSRAAAAALAAVQAAEAKTKTAATGAKVQPPGLRTVTNY